MALVAFRARFRHLARQQQRRGQECQKKRSEEQSRASLKADEAGAEQVAIGLGLGLGKAGCRAAGKNPLEE